jgi:hypothetical protein
MNHGSMIYMFYVLSQQGSLDKIDNYREAALISCAECYLDITLMISFNSKLSSIQIDT